MDKKFSCRILTRQVAGVAMSVALALSLLAAVVVPSGSASAAPNGYQAPFRCGETWYGHTYDSMRIGTRVLQGHGRGNNLAIDFNRNADYGATVLASGSGYAYPGWSPNGLGNYIVIEHGGGYQTVYAHLASIWISSGQYVRQGASLGAVGSTGASSAPHLHYEQRYNGISQQIRFGGYAVPMVHRPYVAVVTSRNC